jgi:minor extracellular protease Epr
VKPANDRGVGSIVDAASFFPSHVPGKHDGHGITIGLLDGTVNGNTPDLVGANIATKDFVGCPDFLPETAGHGTSMALLIVGQGNDKFRGLLPSAHLLTARVIGPGDLADQSRVAAAITWLVGMGATVIALPLGSEQEDADIASAIDHGIARGVRFFAACGRGDGRILFPARHDGVVAVGPADGEGRLLPDARSKPKIDLLAPGWKIAGLSIMPISGSSVACVLAAGMAAIRLGGHIGETVQAQRTS